jgi:hypothetical protein
VSALVVRGVSEHSRATARGTCRVLSLVVACSLSLGSFVGCQSTPAESAPAQADVGAVQSTLDKVYAAFCFEARGNADWDTIRDLSADGAVFVAPISAKKTPRAVGIDEFLSDYHAYVASEAVRNTGLHERILHTRIDLYGSIAHAYVAFEGFVPGLGTVMTRGLDSLQLVKVGGQWRVVSFTTQYASTLTPLPPRFLPPPVRR